MTFIKWLFDTHNMLLYEYEDLPKDKQKEIQTEYEKYISSVQLKGSIRPCGGTTGL